MSWFDHDHQLLVLTFLLIVGDKINESVAVIP